MHGVLEGEVGREPDVEHAEGVLRSFGLDPKAAAEVARRPLPELGGGSDCPRGPQASSLSDDAR
jgi:hypothetical protein